MLFVLSIVNHCLSPPVGRRDVGPGLAAVERAPHVVKKCLQQTEIEKLAGVVGDEHRVAPENVVLENAGEGPGRAAVAGVGPAGLAKVGRDAVELPPADRHLVVVGRIDADRRLVSGVAGDVLTVRIRR